MPVSPSAQLSAAPSPVARRDFERNASAVALLVAARSESDDARRRIEQRVVMEYLGVADAVARRFRTSPQEAGDLRQVAYLGLTKAVQRFEPERGGDIVAFAVPTITGEIKRYLRDASWVVRPPRILQERHSALRAAVPRLAQRLGREPSLAEIAEEAGLSSAEVAEAMECAQSRRPASLDAPVSDVDGVVLGDALAGSAEDYDRAEIAASLAAACRRLTPRERRIVYLRFYREQTQAEIAQECGVTQMQISRLLTKILAVLRGGLSSDLLAA